MDSLPDLNSIAENREVVIADLWCLEGGKCHWVPWFTRFDWELELESCLFNIFSIVVYQNRKIKLAEQVSKGVVSLENLP